MPQRAPPAGVATRCNLGIARNVAPCVGALINTKNLIIHIE